MLEYFENDCKTYCFNHWKHFLKTLQLIFYIGPGVKGVGKRFIKDTQAYFDQNLEGKCFIRHTLAYNTQQARVNEGKHTFIGVFRRTSIIKKNGFMRKTLAYSEKKK